MNYIKFCLHYLSNYLLKLSLADLNFFPLIQSITEDKLILVNSV